MQVSEMARITLSANQDDVRECARLVWQLAVEDCLHRGEQQRNGCYIYHGSLSKFVRQIWPDLSDYAAEPLKRAIYAYLRATGMAKNTKRRDPVTWQIKALWDTDSAAPAVEETTKENDITMPNPNAAQALEPHREKLRAERDARRMAALDTIARLSEPATAEEIAHVVGANVHTLRADLNELVVDGIVFSRQETPEERATRFGGTAFARGSTLFFNDRRIPKRTIRELVPGCVAQANVPESRMTPDEVNSRLWNKLKDKKPRTSFSANSLAELSGTSPEVTRVRIHRLVEAGAVRENGNGVNHEQLFRLVDREAARTVLNQPAAEVLETVVTTPPVPPVPVAPSVEELLARAVAVVAENAELRSEIDTLRAYAQELEAQVEELTRPSPSITAEAARVLGSWQPRSS